MDNMAAAVFFNLDTFTQTLGSILQVSDPVSADPLIFRTTLRHLKLGSALDFRLFIWAPLLDVATPYLKIKKGKAQYSQYYKSKNTETMYNEWYSK
jgi:hypothetical protein